MPLTRSQSQARASVSSWARGGRVPDEYWAISRPTPRWETPDSSPDRRPTTSRDWISVGGGSLTRFPVTVSGEPGQAPMAGGRALAHYNEPLPPPGQGVGT